MSKYTKLELLVKDEFEIGDTVTLTNVRGTSFSQSLVKASYKFKITDKKYLPFGSCMTYRIHGGGLGYWAYSDELELVNE